MEDSAKPLVRLPRIYEAFGLRFELSMHENAVLTALYNNPGRRITLREITRLVYGKYEAEGKGQVVRNMLVHLRRKTSLYFSIIYMKPGYFIPEEGHEFLTKILSDTKNAAPIGDQILSKLEDLAEDLALIKSFLQKAHCHATCTPGSSLSGTSIQTGKDLPS